MATRTSIDLDMIVASTPENMRRLAARGMTYPFQSRIATSDGERAWVFRYSSEGKSRLLLLSRDILTLRALCPDRKILHELSEDARIAVSEPTGDHPGT